MIDKLTIHFVNEAKEEEGKYILEFWPLINLRSGITLSICHKISKIFEKVTYLDNKIFLNSVAWFWLKWLGSKSHEKISAYRKSKISLETWM